ncbi:MAG: iron donor protein CyaY [Pseudomonadota bacterium]
MMTESEFNQFVERTLLQIEEMAENAEPDIDFDLQGEILTLTFPQNKKIIINKNWGAKQLWVATPTGGYHFDPKEQIQWVKDDTGQPLIPFLRHECETLMGTGIDWPD